MSAGPLRGADTGSFHGRLRDTVSGKGLDAVSVTAVDAALNVQTATTDATGAYQFHGLALGTCSYWGALDHYDIPMLDVAITAGVDALANLEGTGHHRTLGVASLAAIKDSTCLCGDGCDKAKWDKAQAAHTAHAGWYCWATAAKMISDYRGGSLLRDEIVVQAKGKAGVGVEPELSLPHDAHAGASDNPERHDAMKHALKIDLARA